MTAPDDQPRLAGFDDYEVTLGDQLRGERATKGKSLLDVQRDLRIKAAYIAAIEDADMSVFPNPGFIAGYVRGYARYLDLNPDEVYARFCAASGFAGIHTDLGAVRQGRPERAPKPGRPADDMLFRPKVPNIPAPTGWMSELSLSALGSVAVLLLVIGGIGYGAWTVFLEIQRITLAPVDGTPTVATELAVDLPEQAPARSALDTIVRPQELAVPRVAPRDGPIGQLDPDETGPRFAEADTPPTTPPAAPPNLADLAAAAEALQARPVQGPPVPPGAPVASEGPPRVAVLATEGAWMRITLPDGSRIYEGLLDKGDRFDLPPDLEAPVIRSGMSGYVYVLIDEVPYGPLGEGTSIAREISLAAQAVREAYPQLVALPGAAPVATTGVAGAPVEPAVVVPDAAAE